MKQNRSQKSDASQIQGLRSKHLLHIPRPPANYEFTPPENQEAHSVSRVSMLSANSNFSGRVKEQQDKLKRAKTEAISTRDVFSEKIDLIQQLIESNMNDLAQEHLRNLGKSIHSCIDNLIACLSGNEEILMEQHEREAQLKKQTMMMFLKLEKSMNTSKTYSTANIRRVDDKQFGICDLANEFADLNWQKANLLKIIDHKENIIWGLKARIRSRDQYFRLQLVNSAYREQQLLKFVADSSSSASVSSKTNIVSNPTHPIHGFEAQGVNSQKFPSITVRHNTSNSSFQSLKQKLLRRVKKRNTSWEASIRSIDEIKALVSAFSEKNFVLTHNKSIGNSISLKLSQLKTEQRILSEIGVEKGEELIKTMTDEQNAEIASTSKQLEGIEKTSQTLEAEMASIRIQLKNILIKHQHTLRILNRRVRQKFDVMRAINRESILQIGSRAMEGKQKYPADSLDIRGDVWNIHLVQTTLATLKRLSSEVGLIVGKPLPRKIDRKSSDKSKALNRKKMSKKRFKALKSKASNTTIGHEITRSLCKIWDVIDCKSTVIEQISAVLSNPVGSLNHFQDKTFSNSNQSYNPTEDQNFKQFSLSKEMLNMSDGLVQNKTTSGLTNSDLLSALNCAMEERNSQIFKEIRQALNILSNHVSYFTMEDQLIKRCLSFDLLPFVDQLKSNLNQRDERLSQSEKRRSELEYELNRLRSQLSTRNVEIINHAHTVRELEENNIFLQGMHETLEKQNQELYSKLEQLREEAKNLRQENGMLRSSAHGQTHKKEPFISLYQSTYVIDMLRKIDTRNLTSNSMRAIHSAIQYLHSSAQNASPVNEEINYQSLYKTHTGSSHPSEQKHAFMAQPFCANSKSVSPKRANKVSEVTISDPYLNNIMPISAKRPPNPISKNRTEGQMQTRLKHKIDPPRSARLKKLADRLVDSQNFTFNTVFLSQQAKIQRLAEKVSKLMKMFVSYIHQLKRPKETQFSPQSILKESYGSLPREGRNIDSQLRFSGGKIKLLAIDGSEKNQSEKIQGLENMFERCKKAMELFKHSEIKIHEITSANFDKYLKLFAEEFTRIRLDFSLQKDLTEKLQRIIKEQQDILKAKTKQISSLETEYLKQLQSGTQNMKTSCTEKMELNRQIQVLRLEISDTKFQNNYLKNLIEEYEKQLDIIQKLGNLPYNDISISQDQGENPGFSFSKIEHPRRAQNQSNIYQTLDHATNMSNTPAEMLYHLSNEHPQKSPKARMFDIGMFQMNAAKNDAEKSFKKSTSRDHEPVDLHFSQTNPLISVPPINAPVNAQSLQRENQGHLIGDPYMRNEVRMSRPRAHSQNKVPEENLEEIFLKRLITEYLPESGQDISSFTEDLRPKHP